MDLLYDVMDQTLIDADGLRCGRVDDIVVEDGFARPARVVALLSGGGAKAEALWPPLRRIVALCWRLLGIEGPLQPVEVPWEQVEHLANDVVLKCPAAALGLDRVSRAVAEQIIGRIPGGNG